MTKRRSALSKIKLCDITFKLKAIECMKKTLEMANNNILFSRNNSVLIVLCSHFFSNSPTVQTALYM